MEKEPEPQKLERSPEEIEKMNEERAEYNERKLSDVELQQEFFSNLNSKFKHYFESYHGNFYSESETKPITINLDGEFHGIVLSVYLNTYVSKSTVEHLVANASISIGDIPGVPFSVNLSMPRVFDEISAILEHRFGKGSFGYDETGNYEMYNRLKILSNSADILARVRDSENNSELEEGTLKVQAHQ